MGIKYKRKLTEKGIQTLFEALVPLHPLHVTFVCLQWRLPFGRVIDLVLSAVSSLFPLVPLLHVVVRGVPVAVKRLRRVRRFQQLWVPIVPCTKKSWRTIIRQNMMKRNRTFYSDERYRWTIKVCLRREKVFFFYLNLFTLTLLIQHCQQYRLIVLEILSILVYLSVNIIGSNWRLTVGGWYSERLKCSQQRPYHTPRPETFWPRYHPRNPHHSHSQVRNRPLRCLYKHYQTRSMTNIYYMFWIKLYREIFFHDLSDLEQRTNEAYLDPVSISSCSCFTLHINDKW